MKRPIIAILLIFFCAWLASGQGQNFPAPINILSGVPITWNSDTGLSRTAAATIAVGNGTQGDVSGSLKFTGFSAAVSNGAELNFVHGGMTLGNNSPLGWTAGLPGATLDTALSRDSAGVVDVGTGAVGNRTGTLAAGAYQSGTNCSAVGSAASPSVAACGSSAAGSFSCATNAVSACTVNTTAVTVNSQIFITQREDTVTGTRLSVTCNVTPSVVIASENITTVVAATSFTFALTQPVTNPDCYSYFIIN